MGISEHYLDISARLVKRDGLHEFGLFAKGSPTLPQSRAAGTSIIRRQDVLLLPPERVHQISHIEGPKLNIAIRRQKLRSGETSYTHSTRKLPTGGGHDLHQAVCV